MAAVGVAWFVANIFVLMILRPPSGQTLERMIVRFPGAWIVVGLPLTLSFGGSALLTAFSFF